MIKERQVKEREHKEGRMGGCSIEEKKNREKEKEKEEKTAGSIEDSVKMLKIKVGTKGRRRK